ncbi:MAG: hypothetical protein V2A78_12380 [bacterium]
MESEKELKARYRVAVILGMGMIGGLILYVVFVEVLKSLHKPFTGFAPFQQMELLKYAFYILAVLLIPAINFLRGILLGNIAAGDKEALLQKLLTATVVTYACCEMPAIFGLVLFLTGGLYKEFYLLWFFSMALMILYFPRYGAWRETLSEPGITKEI